MTDALERALEAVTAARVRDLLAGLVDVPSPPGEERPLAEHLVEVMRPFANDVELMAIDETQASARGRLRSTRTGRDLLLYAPIDTLTVGRRDEDLPWGGPWAEHMLPRAVVDGHVVRGLGAMNPKGHAACVLMAAEAVATADVELDGDLVLAFGAGGMPTNAREGLSRRNIAQGVGASFLLEQGTWADAAIIAKSHWAVNRQEVGLAWLDVTIHGTHTYAGARHRIAYRNPIVSAGKLLPELEGWLADWATRHASGEVEPQGIVGAIEGGWWRMAATVPAVCRLRVDLRLAPGLSPLAARRELYAFVEDWARLHEVEATVELAVSIPGSETPSDAPIYQATVAAWEAETGQRHEPPTGQSGATDANILRNRGIDTVRVGLPKVEIGGEELDFAAGMNTVHTDALVALSRLLVRAALRFCTGPRGDRDE
jgi:acetylornithine deacetylase/succinyl-diaminopimelate desuccinylase-like protein